MLMDAESNGEREDVNLVCRSHRCNIYKNFPEEKMCMTCGDKGKSGIRYFVFRTMVEIIDHVLTPRTEFKKIVGLSHNGSRLDTILTAK